MVNLPPAFLKRMQEFLGDEYSTFLDSYAQPPSAGMRVNSLKISPENFQEISPFPLSPIPWCPTGFYLPHELNLSPGKHPLHAAGVYYLQEPSAMAVAETLHPQPGDRILDLAAAPGGKTTHLACLMAGQGVLVANETHPQRVWELAENLERWGVRHTVLLNETPARLADAFSDYFDKVLLDAPCSGEGMFRKSDAARREWSPQHVLSCAQRQRAILNNAASLVRPGGSLAYSTCTFAPEENEAVIAQFLSDQPQFELLEMPAIIPGAAPGRPDWAQPEEPSLQNVIRLWPHRLKGEGHFIAVLRRKVEVMAVHHRRWQPPLVSKEAARLFKDFCQANLQEEFGGKSLIQEGSYLYLTPEGLPDLGSLKRIRTGLWLGMLKKERFEPSHALAMTLRLEDVQQTVSLPLDEAEAYLRGEILQSRGPDAWVLVSIGGFPLGWGKCVKGMIKNYYPKGLRRT
jgi:NOL1/NOP2/sun family putative RNA methylase